MRRMLCGWLAGFSVAAAPVAAETYPDVVSQSHYVAVRDGTKLAMSVYRPAVNGKPVAKRLPVIFVFTPYRGRFRAPDGKVTQLEGAGAQLE